MPTTRRLRRRGTPLRAGLATVEVMAALVGAHVVAGGSLPGPEWIAVMALAVFGAGLLVLSDRVRPLVALPALVATQLLLHAWLSAMAPGSMQHGDAAMAGAHHVHLGWPMLLAHAVGAGVTALVWELRRRAVDVVLVWSDVPALPTPTRRRARAVARTTALRPQRPLVVAPLRGPPVALARA